MKTGIIIPCYNEETRINQDSFVEFILKNSEYHLCFVNDGSKDATMKILRQMKAKAPQGISIIDVKKNMGKAAAVRAGARYLYTRKDISYVGFMDADLSTDFKDFKDLVRTLKMNDNLSVVFGSRNAGGNGIERDYFRNMFSKIVKSFIVFILGLPIRDTQCGAKVFVRDIIPVVYEEAFISRWLFDVELFFRLKNYFGANTVMSMIFEQPLMRWIHVDDSKLGIKDSFRIPLRLVHIWTNYKFRNNFTLKKSASSNPVISIVETPQMTIAA